jgi:hypothetical protein
MLIMIGFRGVVGLLLAVTAVGASGGERETSRDRDVVQTRQSHAVSVPEALGVEVSILIEQAFNVVREFPGAELRFDPDTGHLMPVFGSPAAKSNIDCTGLTDDQCERLRFSAAINSIPDNPMPGATAQLDYTSRGVRYTVTMRWVRTGTDANGQPIFNWVITDIHAHFVLPNEEK